jgi:hypothetical protein
LPAAAHSVCGFWPSAFRPSAAGWGKDKLAVLLPQQELTVSTSSGLHLATSKIDWVSAESSALKTFPV